VLKDVKVKHQVDTLVTERQIYAVCAHVGIAKIHQISPNVLNVRCEARQHLLHLWLSCRIKDRLRACKDRTQTLERERKETVSLQ
jgi:hypothetical protein